MVSKNLAKRLASRTAVVLEAAALCLGSTSAMAAVVCSSAPVSVPANLDGVYLNIATGATGTSGSGVSGWDINLYQTGTPAGLYFFWPSTPASSYGGVATGTVYDSLLAGATVSAAQAYSVASGGGGAANYVNWQTTTAQTGRYLGVRFFNEATSAINYGWMQIDTGASNGFPATINQYCYDNTGAAIVTGAGVDAAPTLTYNPASTVTFPGGAAGTATASIAITSAGAAGAGQSAVTGCGITGPGAASFGAVSTTPANGIINSTTTSGSIGLSCTRGATEATATLSCTETATPTVAGSPFTRTWSLTCPAAAAAVSPGTVSGTTVTLPTIRLPSTTSSTPLTFTASGSATSVTCTASGAGFSASPSPLNLSPGVPGTVTVSYSGSTAGTFTGSLNCVTTASGGPFTYPLSATVGVSLAPTVVPSLGTVGLWAMLLSFLGLGMLFAARSRS